MDEFYLFVNSGDSLQLFPQNRGGQFRIRLPRSHLMKGTWECALLEMTFVPAFETSTQRMYVCWESSTLEVRMECPSCQRMFSRRDVMLRHHRNKHGTGVPPPPPPPPPPPQNATQESFRFQHPFTMIVSGPTSCGKTFFVKEALRRSTCNPVPERIVWLYRRWQPLYDEIRKTVVPTVEFVRGIPTELEADHFFDTRTRNLLVLDDLMSTSAKDRRINDLFTEGSHHRNLSVVAVNQNLYFGKDPTQRRNCHYLVLFDNPVDRQPVATLGRQMYPSQRHHLMQTFREATRRPFGYLLVDLKAATPEHLRLRSDVLGGGEDDAEAEDEDVDSTGSESNTMEFGEEDVGSESDLMACRACGLVFAHARGLEIHQERDCGDEPSAKRCRTEDDGVEGTYGYELECYLEDLPATVCCADALPDEVSNRPRSFVVNTDDCDGKGIHWLAFHFPREGPVEFFDSFGRSPEYYHRRFMNVLIANGPQYRFSTTQVQP